MKISSPSFSDGDRIPAKYTCNSNNENPSLLFDELPEKAETVALILDDPDAPGNTFTHWTIWNINADNPKIDESSVPGDSVEGMTDFGVVGYGGPCPPAGQHRYYFRAYALDIRLDLERGATRRELEDAMEGHIVDSEELTVVYARGQEFGGRFD
jgi:Raf kinase inhibitor-like YbhB/YbcL family protein